MAVMQALPDAEARRQALDPRRSLCVVAPAGSGKTELLTRRFLCLLATAQEPEEILAFTFTRKAAAEMRERLLQHLSAAAELEVDGASSVAPSMLDEAVVLARAALDRDRERGWELLRNPNRLAVQTIDSFCAWLAAQLPVLSALGGALTISADEAGCRREAAQLLLDELEQGAELGTALEVLLAREDNDVEGVLQLCSDMLKQRDHWLPLVSYRISRGAGDASGAAAAELRVRTALEAARRNLWHEHAAAARSLLGDALPRLAPLLATAACALRQRGAKRSPAPLLLAWAGELDPVALADECQQLLCAPQLRDEDVPRTAATWAASAALLLDAKGQWRRRVDATLGFPPEAVAEKQVVAALLEELREHDSEPLSLMSQLPGSAVEESEWRALTAVQLLLWHSAARLELVFGERREIDYIGKALAAVRALGAGEELPSELAIALGCRLRHILVDEFQDTSHSQFQLLERLVAGWAEHNESDPQAPCSLFAVGDSMQSCYAFRNADPRLFQRLQGQGINGLVLETVALSANFRSRPEIITWVNDCFAPLFGQRQHASRGAVPYCPATAVHSGGSSVAEVCCEQLVYGEGAALKTVVEAERAEAERVLHWIEVAQSEESTGRTAVLVRSRSHLRALLPMLARAGLSWSAEAMDPLAMRPAVRDLAALTQALADPADRLAWLALLRAPWCGLGHAAIQQLAAGGSQSLWQSCLVSADRGGGLAAAEQLRLRRFVAAMAPAMARRGRAPHAELSESAWLALGGPACFLPGVDQAADVAALFALLRELGREPEVGELERRLERLYATPAGDGRLQLMTIHNAKGLEFDTVILCGLHRRQRHDNPPLMRWESRHFDSAEGGAGSEALLFALRPPAGGGGDALYGFLKGEARARGLLEEKRLLYVASTRAIRRLHLLACADSEREPAAGSLLQLLWQLPGRRESFTPVSADSGADDLAVTVGGAPLGQRRLIASWQRPPLARAKDELFAGNRIAAPPPTDISDFGGDNLAARRIGTVLHDALEQISWVGAAPWRSDADRLRGAEAVWAAELREAGFSPKLLREGLAKLRRGVLTALEDERGRWLLDPSHDQAESELSLLYFDDQGVARQARVDRSFIADGERWIIDYKSSEPREAEPLADFLQREEQSYRAQLGAYAAALRALDPLHPIRLALYFPLLPCLHELRMDGVGEASGDTRATPPH